MKQPEEKILFFCRLEGETEEERRKLGDRSIDN